MHSPTATSTMTDALAGPTIQLPEAGEGQNHKQADAESGDQHVTPILREFAVMAAYLAHQNQA